jgi:hypothetical protein
LYDFVNDGGLQVDILALRQLHPDLMDFSTWLEKEGKARLEAFDPLIGLRQIRNRPGYVP